MKQSTKKSSLSRYHKLHNLFSDNRTFTLVEKLEIELLLVVVIVSLGSYYFSQAEGMSYFDSLYFSIISMAGVGYGDIVPHTVGGKIIAMFYAIVGLPLFLVAGTFIVQLLTNSQPKRKKKVVEEEKKIIIQGDKVSEG